jgi:hypothetical protein
VDDASPLLPGGPTTGAALRQGLPSMCRRVHANRVERPAQIIRSCVPRTAALEARSGVGRATEPLATRRGLACRLT